MSDGGRAVGRSGGRSEAASGAAQAAEQVVGYGALSPQESTARPPDRPTALDSSDGPSPDSDRVNILLVDDQPANLLALEAMLQGLGQTLVKAESGREALKRLLTHDFAVILLDVKMPDMDGFETAALIRQRDKSRDTPIIFLTAADKTHTEAVRGYAVGAVDYLVKPVVPEFVRSKVSVFVELAKKNEQLRRQAELLRESEQAARELAETRAELVSDLEHKNRELESFSYAVSHDLRAPLRRIEAFGRAVLESQGEQLDGNGRRFMDRIQEASRQMSQLIDDVLYLSKVSRAEVRQQEIDLSGLVESILERLREADPGRTRGDAGAPGRDRRGRRPAAPDRAHQPARERLEVHRAGAGRPDRVRHDDRDGRADVLHPRQRRRLRHGLCGPAVRALPAAPSRERVPRLRHRARHGAADHPPTGGPGVGRGSGGAGSHLLVHAGAPPRVRLPAGDPCEDFRVLADRSSSWTSRCQAYRERRVAVITLIASKPIENVRAFSDAFRIRRNKEGD